MPPYNILTYCITCDRVTPMCNYCVYTALLARANKNKTGLNGFVTKDLDDLASIIAPTKSVHDFQFLELTKKEINRLELLAGPYGRVMFKIMELRKNDQEGR